MSVHFAADIYADNACRFCGHRLLGAQSVNRIERARAFGRHPAENNADGGREARAEDNCSIGYGEGCFKRFRTDKSDQESQENTNYPADDGQCNGFDQKLISFVLSETETSIMFIMPMPPTTRAIEAMPPSIVLSMVRTEFMTFIRLSRLMIEKALSASL